MRSKAEKEFDKEFISNLYLKGYSCRAIANKLCIEKGNEKYITYRTVNTDINYLLKEWRDARVEDIDQLKSRELEKINKLEMTYWEAWEKSITDYQKTNKKMKAKAAKTEGNKTLPSEQEIATMDMISMGNPSYLAGIERCIQLRCKILGIEAPVKTETKHSGEIKINPWTIAKSDESDS